MNRIYENTNYMRVYCTTILTSTFRIKGHAFIMWRYIIIKNAWNSYYQMELM